MKSFEQKKKDLAKLRDKLKRSKLAVLTSFARAGEKGLNVSQMRDLKKSLKETDSEYVVGKKTLVDKAIRERAAGFKDLSIPSVFGYEGSMGVVFGYGDEAAAAKNVYGFARKNPALRFFGALFGNKFVDDKQFIELAKLPSKDIMIGRVVSMIKYPISGLVNVLQSNTRNLVGVLKAIGDKL